MDNQNQNLNREEFIDQPIGEGLSLSDYFDDSVPYEVKPVPFLRPMEEIDFPIQTKDIFAGLFDESPKSQLKMSPLIKESESVDYKGIGYEWSSDGVSVVIVYQGDNSSDVFFAASVFSGEFLKSGFYSDWEELADNLNKNVEDVTDAETHGDLDLMVEENAPEFPGSNVLQGRLFEIQDPQYRYILGFWEPSNVVRAFKYSIEAYLKQIGINPEEILWSYGNGHDVITYAEMFDVKIKKKERSKEQLEMLKQIHLNAALKKKVLKLPPHPFQLLADKLGITVAQLRQIAGKAIAEEKIQTVEETVSLLEKMEIGEGFWLDPKGVFHNVDINGNHGHLDWARKHFKIQNMDYSDVFKKGYIWVGVMNVKEIFFAYHYDSPSPVQMYMLKKTAEDEGMKLFDKLKQEYIDTSLLQETDMFDYADESYSYDTSGVSVLILIKEKDHGDVYVGSIHTGPNLGFVSNWKELEDELNGDRMPDMDYTHIDLKTNVESMLFQMGYSEQIAETIAFRSSLDGRLFKSPNFEGGYCMGFWDSRRDVSNHYDMIVEYLKRVGVSDPTKILWTADGGDVIMDHNTFFGKKHIPQRSKAAVELQRKLHVMDGKLKKQLLQIPPNRLQTMADKYGVPLAQFRQMIGSMDEAEYAMHPTQKRSEVTYDWHSTNIVGLFVIWNASLYASVNSYDEGDWKGHAKFHVPIKDIEEKLNEMYPYKMVVTHDALVDSVEAAYKDLGRKLPTGGSYLNTHGDIAGRVWKFKSGYVIGFWQSIKTVRTHWKRIEWCLNEMGVDPKKGFYYFQGDFEAAKYSYWDITGETKVKEIDPTTLELMKIQHLNAQAKRALLQNIPPNRLQKLADDMGIPLAKLRQVLGSMDEVEGAFDEHGNAILWRYDEAIGIFTFYNESLWVIQLGKADNTKYISNNKKIESQMNSHPDLFKKFTDSPDPDYLHTHFHLRKLTKLAGELAEVDVGELLYHGKACGRVFRLESGKEIVGFWQDVQDIRQYWSQVKNILETMGVDVEKAKYTFENVYDPEKEYSYYDITGEKEIEKVDSKKLELMKLQHLSPEVKKLLLKQYPINRLQKLADEMGITLPKLRQMLGSMDEVEDVTLPDSKKMVQWYSTEAVSVFLIYDNLSVWTKNTGKGDPVLYRSDIGGSRKPTKFFSTNTSLADKLNDLEPVSIKTHGTLKGMMDVAIEKSRYGPGYARIEGRIFNTKEGVFVTFWQNTTPVRNRWDKVEEIVRSLGYDPKKARYTFSADGEISYSYEQAKGKAKTKAKSAYDLAVQKMLHLSPQVKKAVLKFPPNRLQKLADKMKITLVQLRQMLGSMDESPDSIIVGGDRHMYGEESVISTFIIGEIEGHRGWLGTHERKRVIYRNGEPVTPQINNANIETHGLLRYQYFHHNPSSRENRIVRGTHGRLFKVGDKYYASFWENKDKCLPWKKEIEDCINFFTHGKAKEVFYQFSGMGVQGFDDYYDAFNVTKPSSQVQPDVEAEFEKQLHLMPPLEKARLLKKLGAVKPNKLHIAADKLGMTVAQIRQMLGRADESKQVINEYADHIVVNDRDYDYTDTSGPYAAFACGYFYGDRGWAYYKNSSGDIILNGSVVAEYEDANPTHGDIIDYVIPHDDYGDEESKEIPYQRGVHGRVFLVDNQFYVTFWESKEKCLQWKKDILECLNDITDGDIKNFKFQFRLMDVDQFMDYYDAWDETKPQPVSDTEANAARMEQLHLLPPARKAELLKQMGAAGPQRLHIAADKLGMTVAQLRQALGRTDENVNVDVSLNATLIWLEKDGTVHDTDDTQHGIYVADNPELFGVSNDLVQKVFKKFGEDYDEAAAIMCEKAFQKRWMRVVKMPWRNKIMVEGQEPTKEQRRVLEDWFFEDKNTDIIWQRWVSSKFGPPQPVTLFTSKNVLETNK